MQIRAAQFSGTTFVMFSIRSYFECFIATSSQGKSQLDKLLPTTVFIEIKTRF